MQEHSVEVICFEFENWSRENNEKLLKEFDSVTFTRIPAGRSPFVPWFLSVLYEVVFRFLFSWMPLSKKQLGYATSRRSFLLEKKLNGIRKPDWVIGHNPGSLWPVWYAKKKFACRAGFDVEDYHPGEGSNIRLQKVTKKLMKALLPDMDYVSFASPFIKEAVQADRVTEGKWLTVLNYFPASEFTFPTPVEGKLKLIWFSQNISSHRGLETILAVIRKYPEDIVLHLFGNCDSLFYDRELKGINNVFLHSPLPQGLLHNALKDFDIGLAIEPGKDANNKLALSNKILAYFQAGLYILASNTRAQEWFINEHPVHGMVTSLSAEDMEQAVQKLIGQKAFLRASSKERFEEARGYNWGSESAGLSQIWKERD